MARHRFEAIITMDVPDSSIGITTRYGLDGPGIESRWGVRFSTSYQSALEPHPAFCKIVTGSLYCG
jgi:hypothetical protein